MSAKIFLEGGGDSKELHSRCRYGFRTLLENCDFKGHMPQLVACGGRSAAFEDFQNEHDSENGSVYVAMLVDSEEPVEDLEEPWKHLKERER